MKLCIFCRLIQVIMSVGPVLFSKRSRSFVNLSSWCKIDWDCSVVNYFVIFKSLIKTIKDSSVASIRTKILKMVTFSANRVRLMQFYNFNFFKLCTLHKKYFPPCFAWSFSIIMSIVKQFSQLYICDSS